MNKIILWFSLGLGGLAVATIVTLLALTIIAYMRLNKMSTKDTALLIEELKVIAESMGSYYIAKELLAAAERLRELEIIAEFYRKEAERLAIKIGRKEKCKNT